MEHAARRPSGTLVRRLVCIGSGRAASGPRGRAAAAQGAPGANKRGIEGGVYETVFVRAISLMLLAFYLPLPSRVAEMYSSSTPLYDASEIKSEHRSCGRGLAGPTSFGRGVLFNDVVGPRTSSAATSTRSTAAPVEAMGGGVSQVAATLYLALTQRTASSTWRSRPTAASSPKGYGIRLRRHRHRLPRGASTSATEQWRRP